LAVSRSTLGYLLERVHDEAPSVRKLAFEVIRDKLPLKTLTIAQRAALLSEGLTDRSGLHTFLALCSLRP